MTTRIIYPQTTNTGKMLAQGTNHVMEVVAEVRRLKAILDSSTSGSDWAALAAELGGGLDNDDAQNIWTIWSNAAAAIDCPAVAELARLDQG